MEICFLTNVSAEAWATHIQTVVGVLAIGVSAVVVIWQHRATIAAERIKQLGREADDLRDLLDLVGMAATSVSHALACLASVKTANAYLSAGQGVDTLRRYAQMFDGYPMHTIRPYYLARVFLEAREAQTSAFQSVRWLGTLEILKESSLQTPQEDLKLSLDRLMAAHAELHGPLEAPDGRYAEIERPHATRKP